MGRVGTERLCCLYVYPNLTYVAPSMVLTKLVPAPSSHRSRPGQVRPSVPLPPLQPASFFPSSLFYCSEHGSALFLPTHLHWLRESWEVKMAYTFRQPCPCALHVWRTHAPPSFLLQCLDLGTYKCPGGQVVRTSKPS